MNSLQNYKNFKILSVNRLFSNLNFWCDFPNNEKRLTLESFTVECSLLWTIFKPFSKFSNWKNYFMWKKPEIFIFIMEVCVIPQWKPDISSQMIIKSSQQYLLFPKKYWTSKLKIQKSLLMGEILKFLCHWIQIILGIINP